MSDTPTILSVDGMGAFGLVLTEAMLSGLGGGGRGDKGEGRIAKSCSRVLMDVVTALAQTAANSQITSKSFSSNERRPLLLQLKHIFLCQFTTSFYTQFRATFNVVTQ